MDKRTLGKSKRITRRSDFNRLFETGRRATDGWLMLLAEPNELDYSRCGVAVSGRHGVAPARNRVKRLCREAFRLDQYELPAGWDFILVPRPGREHTLGRLRSSLASLAIKVTAGQGGTGRDGDCR